MTSLPELKVTVFSDYICPFCYVGHHRLKRLRDSYDLKINWCFLEIHPETSADGEPVDSLDYPSEQWQQMMNNLKQVAQEEEIPLADISFITNSKHALLLSEATKQCGADKFYRLHEALFNAYFVDSKNIGDQEVLKDIAKNCNVDNQIINACWDNNDLSQQLINNYNTARHYKVQSVPSFIFKDKILTGVVSEQSFRDAAATMTSSSQA